MHIFLDESGTHKQNGNTAIAVIFVANNDLEQVGNAVIEAEKQLGIDYFHWADHNWNFKEKFLQKISHTNFTVKIITIKNPFVWSHYEKALKYSLVNEKSIEKLVIDGKKTRQYKREYKKILRDQGVILKRLVIGNDRSFPILRIADLVAGLARSYSEKPEEVKVRRLFDKLSSHVVYFSQE